jgi:hypothetical protein
MSQCSCIVVVVLKIYTIIITMVICFVKMVFDGVKIYVFYLFGITVNAIKIKTKPEFVFSELP